MDAELVIQSIKNRIRNGVVTDTDKVLGTLIRLNIGAEVNRGAMAIIDNYPWYFCTGEKFESKKEENNEKKRRLGSLLFQLQNILNSIEMAGYKKAA